jgi:hypothetical protein
MTKGKSFIPQKTLFIQEFNKNETKREKMEIGIFDEFERLNDEEPVTVEHLFADFRKLDDGTFQKEFQ